MRLYLLSLYLLVYFLLEVVPLGVAPLGRAFLPGSLMAQSPVPPVSSSTSPTEPPAQKKNPGNDSSPLKDSANSSSPKQTTLDQKLAVLQAVLDQLLKQQTQANVPVDQEKLEKESAPLLEKLVRTKLQRPQSWQHLPGENSDASEEALPASNPSDPSTRYNLKGNFYPGNSPRIVPIQPLPQNANPAIVPLSSAKAQGVNPTGGNSPTNPTFSPNPSSGGTTSSGTPGQTPPSSFSLPGLPKASSGQNAGGSVENEGLSAYFLRQSALQQLTNTWYDDKEGFLALCQELSRTFDASCTIDPLTFPKRSITAYRLPNEVDKGLILDNFSNMVTAEAKWLEKPTVSYPDASQVLSTLYSLVTLSDEIVHSRPFEDLGSAAQMNNADEVLAKIEKIRKDIKTYVERLKNLPSWAGHAAGLSPEQWGKTLSKLLPLLDYDQRKRLIQHFRLDCQGQAIKPDSNVCSILDGIKLNPSPSTGASSKGGPLAFLSDQLSSFFQLLPPDELPGFVDALSDAWSVSGTAYFSDGASTFIGRLVKSDLDFLEVSLNPSSIPAECFESIPIPGSPLLAIYPNEDGLKSLSQYLSIADWESFFSLKYHRQVLAAYEKLLGGALTDLKELSFISSNNGNSGNYHCISGMTQGQRQGWVVAVLKAHAIASHAYQNHELWFGSLLDAASKEDLLFDPCVVSVMDSAYKHLFDGAFSTSDAHESMEKSKEYVLSDLKLNLTPPTFQVLEQFLKTKDLVAPLNDILTSFTIINDRIKIPPLLDQIPAASNSSIVAELDDFHGGGHYDLLPANNLLTVEAYSPSSLSYEFLYPTKMDLQVFFKKNYFR